MQNERGASKGGAACDGPRLMRAPNDVHSTAAHPARLKGFPWKVLGALTAWLHSSVAREFPNSRLAFLLQWSMEEPQGSPCACRVSKHE